MFRANEATKQSMLIPNVVSSVALALGGELHMNTFKQTEGFITVYLDRARNLEPLSKHALVWKKRGTFAFSWVRFRCFVPPTHDVGRMPASSIPPQPAPNKHFACISSISAVSDLVQYTMRLPRYGAGWLADWSDVLFEELAGGIAPTTDAVW